MKIFILTILLLVSFTKIAVAGTSSPDSLYQEQPLWFTVVNKDYFIGETVSGLSFTQYRIVSGEDVRIHKFVIADQFFYVSDRGYIEATDDLSAVSIYLSLV